MACRLGTRKRCIFAGFALALAALLAIIALRSAPDSIRASGGSNSIVAADGSANSGDQPSLQLDWAGNPVVTYNTEYLTLVFLKVLHCGNPTCTGGNSITAPDPAQNVGFGSLQLDAVGYPVISYLGDLGQPNPTLEIMHCNDPDCSGQDESIVEPIQAETPLAMSPVRLDAVGNPVLAYRNGAGTVKLLHCGDANCSAGNSIEATTSGSSGQLGLELDSAGLPVILYNPYQDLILVRCADANCSSFTTSPSIALSSGGFAFTLASGDIPVVTYPKTNGAGLAILRCGNQDCSASNVTNVVYPQQAIPNSMALGATENPVLAFTDSNSNLLKVVRCGDATCGSGNTLTEPDAGTATQFGSLALDLVDDPVVAYKATDNLDLRVLHCVTDYCGAKGATPTPLPTATPTPSPTPCPAPCLLVSIGADRDGGTDDCDTSGGSTTCDVALNTEFTVNAYLNNTDSIGPYDALQVLLQYSGVQFTPAGKQNPKVVWPDCALIGSAPGNGFFAAGCAVGIGSAGSTYHGLVVKATFNCTADGSVTMVHSLSDTSIYDHQGDAHAESGPNETLTINCVPPAPYPTDTDGDGCPDMNEAGPSPYSGGQRSFLNSFDYFNPTHDGLNRVDDVLAVRDQYYTDSGDPGYTQDTDRALIGPSLWNLGPPDGKQRIDDVLNALHQYFHDCS